jgi:hypothetical protein
MIVIPASKLTPKFKLKPNIKNPMEDSLQSIKSEFSFAYN